MPLADETRRLLQSHLSASYWRSIARRLAQQESASLVDVLVLLDTVESALTKASGAQLATGVLATTGALAATGAAAGSLLGPAGTAGGAIVGGLTGLTLSMETLLTLSLSKRAAEEERRLDKQMLGILAGRETNAPGSAENSNVTARRIAREQAAATEALRISELDDKASALNEATAIDQERLASELSVLELALAGELSEARIEATLQEGREAIREIMEREQVARDELKDRFFLVSRGFDEERAQVEAISDLRIQLIEKEFAQRRRFEEELADDFFDPRENKQARRGVAGVARSNALQAIRIAQSETVAASAKLLGASVLSGKSAGVARFAPPQAFFGLQGSSPEAALKRLEERQLRELQEITRLLRDFAIIQ